jgi:hypothetical protein
MKHVALEIKEIDELLYALDLIKKESGVLQPIQEKLRKRLQKATRRITPASAKGKGRELQKWVCRRISLLINLFYDQQNDQCLIHSREMGQAGIDIILRGEAQHKFPYSIECKSVEQFSIPSTIKQAKNNMAKGTDWLIVHKRKSFQEPVVILSWEGFEKLFRRGQ